jgi:hypothetical protein
MSQYSLGIRKEKEQIRAVYPLKSNEASPELVAHAYNPRYPGSREQDNHCSKPAWTNSS